MSLNVDKQATTKENTPRLETDIAQIRNNSGTITIHTGTSKIHGKNSSQQVRITTLITKSTFDSDERTMNYSKNLVDVQMTTTNNNRTRTSTMLPFFSKLNTQNYKHSTNPIVKNNEHDDLKVGKEDKEAKFFAEQVELIQGHSDNGRTSNYIFFRNDPRNFKSLPKVNQDNDNNESIDVEFRKEYAQLSEQIAFNNNSVEMNFVIDRESPELRKKLMFEDVEETVAVAVIYGFSSSLLLYISIHYICSVLLSGYIKVLFYKKVG